MQPLNGVKVARTDNMSGDSDNSSTYHRSVSEGEYVSPGQKRSLDGALNGRMEYGNMHETKKYHRMIEKRRRDRINECIYQLKDLLPTEMLKSTSKPMEKAVILELVVQHMQSIADKRGNPNGEKSNEYVEGFKSCADKMFKHLENVIDEHQTKSLMRKLEDEMPKAHLRFDATAKEQDLRSDEDEMQMQMTESSDSSSARNERQNSPSPTHQDVVLSVSSLSSISSSPSSELSLCTDNSDSSSSNNAYPRSRTPKRKVFQHHRSSTSTASSQIRHPVANEVSTAPSSVAQAQMPVFVNMPFVMNPGVVPQPQIINPEVSESETTNTKPMQCMMKPTQVQVPGGMMMPQMTQDMNCGIQFPMFFVAPTPMQQVDGQQMVTANNQPKPMQTGPMLFQPTMMMPVRDQGNFICMPSFPMMPQFQGTPVIPMQSPLTACSAS